MAMPDKTPDDESLSIDDKPFEAWLRKQFANACKRERRWKPHTAQKHAMHEYIGAINMKRCIRECATFNQLQQNYRETIVKADNILAKAMERNELSPATYQQVIKLLENVNERMPVNE